ncbi:hypothetical protein R3P38DRAFT_2770897 [Favolaschia claudopus]|uniref:Uncharacterized protein n=1 Tax=Favolaschia claudopus TaxID=2862362 RepID=A0AAW0CCK1_9AGAR
MADSGNSPIPGLIFNESHVSMWMNWLDNYLLMSSHSPRPPPFTRDDSGNLPPDATIALDVEDNSISQGKQFQCAASGPSTLISLERRHGRPEKIKDEIVTKSRTFVSLRLLVSTSRAQCGEEGKRRVVLQDIDGIKPSVPADLPPVLMPVVMPVFRTPKFLGKQRRAPGEAQARASSSWCREGFDGGGSEEVAIVLRFMCLAVFARACKPQHCVRVN